MRLLAQVACCAVLALASLAANAIPHFSTPPSVFATLPAAAGEAVAVTESGELAYVANASLDRVAIVDQTMNVSYVPVGHTPRFIASGISGALFFTSNAGDNTVSVAKTFNSAVAIPVGGSGPIVVDFDKAYLLRSDGVVVVIDPASITTTSFDTGLRSPVGHALNQARNRLYVADASGEVRVFDITASSPAQTMESFRLPGAAVAIAATADPRLYVLTDASGGSINEIDLSSNAVRTYALPGAQGPRALSVGTGTVFAGFSNGLWLLDIVTHNVNIVRVGAVRAIASDPVSSETFVLLDGSLYIVDPRTMESYIVPVAPGSTQVKFIYKSCNAFVAGPTLTIVHSPCGDDIVGGIRAHALWWVPEGAESGWGLNIAHHGYVGILFATWFTYDANGQPTWFVMSNGLDQGKNQYSGTLYRTTGPAFSAAAFDPSKVTRTPVGTMDIGVTSVNDAFMSAKVNGVTITKTLAKQIFSWPVPLCDAGGAEGATPVYQDLWWNPSESGWGLNIAHQGNILFITWFTYDTDGSPVWFVGSDVEKTGNATYSGTLYKTFGPPMTASPWDPSKVSRMPVGNATLTFRDDDNGTFAYTVSGISGSKEITRQIFATPATRCR